MKRLLMTCQRTNLAATFGNRSVLHVQAEIDIEFIPTPDPLVQVGEAGI